MLFGRLEEHLIVYWFLSSVTKFTLSFMENQMKLLSCHHNYVLHLTSKKAHLIELTFGNYFAGVFLSEIKAHGLYHYICFQQDSITCHTSFYFDSRIIRWRDKLAASNTNRYAILESVFEYLKFGIVIMIAEGSTFK